MLVVDSDSSVARTFRRLLEKKGYNVFVAETAKEAYEHLSENHYECALIDIESFNNESVNFSQVKETAPGTLKIIFTDFPKVKINLEDRSDTIIYLEKPVQPEKLFKLIEEKLYRKT